MKSDLSKLIKITLFLLLQMFLVINSKIKVYEPESLKNKFLNGEIETNLATFGDIPYGASLYGRILYDIDNTDTEMACKPLTTINVGNIFAYGYDTFPVVMVDRGSCSFVTKTRNAQIIGAKVIIIINNNDDDINNIYAIDDGTGTDINIPAILISKKDGDILKEYLKKKPQFENLQVLIEFEIPKSDVINFELIMSSTNKEMYNLISELEEPLVHFDNKVLNFYPVYYIQSHPEWIPGMKRGDKSSTGMSGSNTGDNKGVKEEKEINSPDCFGNGAYCYFFDTEALDLNVFQGQQVLLEDLRQICIFKERKEIEINEFIQYMKAFYSNCIITSIPSIDESCSKKSMKSIGFDDMKIKGIDDCVKGSFKNADKSVWYKTDNELLKKEKRFLRKMHVILNPSVIVNKKLIYVRSF